MAFKSAQTPTLVKTRPNNAPKAPLTSSKSHLCHPSHIVAGPSDWNTTATKRCEYERKEKQAAESALLDLRMKSRYHYLRYSLERLRDQNYRRGEEISALLDGLGLHRSLKEQLASPGDRCTYLQQAVVDLLRNLDLVSDGFDFDEAGDVMAMVEAVILSHERVMEQAGMFCMDVKAAIFKALEQTGTMEEGAKQSAFDMVKLPASRLAKNCGGLAFHITMHVSPRVRREARRTQRLKQELEQAKIRSEKEKRGKQRRAETERHWKRSSVSEKMDVSRLVWLILILRGM